MLSNKTQILALALAETNNWFASTAQRPDLTLNLMDAASAGPVARAFVAGIERHRQVEWDWSALFHRRVKHQDAWMFAIVCRGRPRAMCYGKIEVRHGFVAIEYLERRPYTRGLRGLTAPAAFQFAKTVAVLLNIQEVRLNQPFPQLVRYYIRTLGVSRHPPVGGVQYLLAMVKP